ncbi:tRNA uridine-5-carboxymethylaminomethyl(34) synthesis GTPase MnmE [Candidatus Epulonipiscium viviparus]|uniref:tRNA uridine-5-carboxymethylaminomethyl(34) synthesis GTPase MnmE n=1 Tax=Candidatus Epulonipiscium viviparus TaxID=420336 RepID=UPI00016BFDE7|nr:tRNA uridine-5-carboxymethylaminomethyl(34) synthesis GTPase MnmE [Candidatus Epulopiscium viviparus]
MFFDTIAAISTPVGQGGIGVIRVSGSSAISIVNKIFTKNLNNKKSHTIHYGYIVSDGLIIDEVLVMLMKAPKTFTREDIVEVNCHGGYVVLNRVLELLLVNGARLATAGEFTKRAFLNGRIDLSQVEAIMDIISAKTNLSLAQATSQLMGNLSKNIKKYQNILLEIIARIEVSIDYPEYDEAELISDGFEEDITRLIADLKAILETAATGKIIREGAVVTIVGRPNVGKSSLLNALLEEDKAIVTNIAGTTRDIVSEHFSVEGVPFILQDTAGIRDTADAVERIGVERSKEAIEKSDLVIMLLDATEKISIEEVDLMTMLKNRNTLFVVNKIDCVDKYSDDDKIFISATTGEGIDELKAAMKAAVVQNLTMGTAVISNIRQKTALSCAIEALEKVEDAINAGFSVDFLAIDLQDAYSHLGMIIGEEVKEEIINGLFERFCLGK